MNTQSRTVRVFLSSTFRDFAEERDLLVRKVFPELRRKCRERQVELVDVDLRWGITEEEAQQGRVLPICLAEIDRSRPFFMGFIGERYGWVPESEKYDLSLIMEQPWLDEHRGGKSVTELEMLHGVLNNPAMEDRAFFYFRDAAYSNSKGGAYLSESEEDKAKLEALKDRIRKSGYPVVENYPSPEALAERVKEDLWRLIDEAFPESEVPDALTQERMRHEQFAASRLGLYLGGEGYFAALDAAMSSEPCRPVLVTGASGGGKSALLANWMERFSQQTPEAFVLIHFLAVGADAAHPVGLATRLLKEISRFTGEELVLEGDPRKALHMLSPWLEKAGAFAKKNGKIFVLLVDALVKLSDTRNLDWWPRKLPDGVRLVVSCLDGEVLDAARIRMDWSEVKVSPLGADERSKFVEDYFGKYRKSLPAEQKALVLEHALSGNPLFLRTLLEELRVFGVHEELRGRLAHYLACETIDDLFERVLERVESDNTPESVRAVLEVLWAAKESFAEDELLEVTGLPPAVWARIHIALDESLVGAGGRLAFSHDYLRKAVQDRYLAEEKDRKSIRKKLAEFCASAMESGRKELSPYIRRHAVEHFLEVEDWDNATAALSDLEFIEARAIAQELPAMLKDYAEAVKLLPEGEKERQTEAARQAELDRYAKELVEYSATWSRIRGGSGEAEPTLPRPVKSVRLWSEEEIAAERKRMTEAPNRLDIVKAFRVFVATNSAPLQQYSTQDGFAANLARNDAPAGPVHGEGKRRLEPLKCIKLIKQFAPEEVYNPLPACEALLEGNGRFGGCFDMLSISFDGKRLVAVQHPDESSIVWSINTTTGKQFKIFEGTFFAVSSLLLNPSGTSVFCGMENGDICVWNAESGELIGVLKGHSGPVNCIALSADGQRLMSAGDDKIIRLWNCKSMQCIGILEGHKSPVKSVVFSANGQRAGSASDDKTIRIWDVFSNQCLNIFEEYKDVSAIILNSKGSKLAAVCSDELIFWDLDSAKVVQKIQSEFKGNAFDESPFKINASADGMHLISGSSLGVHFWDIMTGTCFKAFDVNPAEFLAASANCHHFVICFKKHIVKIIDTKSGCTIKELEGFTSYVGNAILSGDGLRLVTLHYNNEIRFWDLEKSYFLKNFERHDGQVRSIRLDNKKRNFVSSCDNESWVWDIKTGKLLEKKSREWEENVFLSPDGLSCGFWDNLDEDTTEIMLWNKNTEKIITELKIQNGDIHKIIITADCKRFISQSDYGEIRVWDLFSGKCLRVFNDCSREKRPFLLSPDDRKIIFSRKLSFDDIIHVVDVNSGEELMWFEGLLDVVTSLELSPDGRFLFSGGWSDDIIVWDAIADEFICLFKSPMLSRFRIDWIQKKLCAGFADGRVEFYDIENLPLGPLITTAHREIISEDLPASPVTACPPCCGQLISIPVTIADRIKHWALEGGYTDPDLLLDCPNCSTPLRMNPFFVDIQAND